ncbi:unnamed protein product [Merluccius merluccius]
MEDLEGFLCRWDVAQLRRRELLHKRWTECVWLPIQWRVEKRVSRRCCDEADRLRCLYADYLRHCNAKGFVSLDCYDPQEYNPFLLVTEPHAYQSGHYAGPPSDRPATSNLFICKPHIRLCQ